MKGFYWPYSSSFRMLCIRPSHSQFVHIRLRCSSFCSRLSCLCTSTTVGDDCHTYSYKHEHGIIQGSFQFYNWFSNSAKEGQYQKAHFNPVDGSHGPVFCHWRGSYWLLHGDPCFKASAATNAVYRHSEHSPSNKVYLQWDYFYYYLQWCYCQTTRALPQCDSNEYYYVRRGQKRRTQTQQRVVE